MRTRWETGLPIMCLAAWAQLFGVVPPYLTAKPASAEPLSGLCSTTKSDDDAHPPGKKSAQYDFNQPCCAVQLDRLHWFDSKLAFVLINHPPSLVKSVQVSRERLQKPDRGRAKARAPPGSIVGALDVSSNSAQRAAMLDELAKKLTRIA